MNASFSKKKNIENPNSSNNEVKSLVVMISEVNIVEENFS